MTKKKLVLIISGVLLLIGVAILLFLILSSKKIILDSDQFGSSEFIDISGEEYEKMSSEKKSFLVVVDQDGCITAAGMKKIAKEIMDEKNVKVYRIMFSDVREISMHDQVKHYPSFVIVEKGKIKAWLKADADEDTERYKNKEELKNWLDSYISW